MPAHKPAPMADAIKNDDGAMPKAPATGGATVAKPGMNLPNTSYHTPHLANRASVWLTQELGLIDILHSKASTR